MDTTRKRRPAIDTFEHGRIQPQAVDLEEAVLGAIMLESSACATALSLIKSPEVFYKDQHKVIFRAIQTLYAGNKPVDIRTVVEQLKSQGELDNAGGAHYIVGLTNIVSSSANMEYHIAVVQEKWLRREMIRLSSQVIRESYEETEDVFDSIDTYMLSVMGLYNSINVSSAEQIGAIAKRNAEIIRNSTNTDMIGLPSGFRNIDHVTNGWQAGDLIIVAGRPGMGKTAFGISLIYNMAVKRGVPVGYISLEMTKSQVVMRIQSILMQLPYQDLRNGALSQTQLDILDADVKTLLRTKAYVDDTPSLTIVQLRAKVLEMVRSYGVQLVMIDYLQLMSGASRKGQSREQEVSEISRGLKILAKELNIPIIAFSQLSRKVEDRGGKKKPILSDLRESGAIEQDADLVMFLWRPEYYGEMRDEMGTSYENVGIAIIEKHRNGSTGEYWMRFEKTLMQYKNYDYGERQIAPPKEFYEAKGKEEDIPF